MQKTVIPSPAWSMNSETDGDGRVVVVVLCCKRCKLQTNHSWLRINQRRSVSALSSRSN